MAREVYVSTKAGAVEAGAVPPSWPWRFASIAATVAALAASCLVIAWWFWRLAAPVPTSPPAAADTGNAAAQLAATAPFGRPVVASRVPTGKAAVATRPSVELRLLGILAGSKGRGQALFRLPDTGPVLVSVGAAITPGVELAAVFPDRVQLRDGGEAREIVLRAPPAASLVTRAPAAGATTRPPGAGDACAAPPGFKGSTYRINAELLEGMAAQPASWTRLLTASSAGLKISEGGGLAAMLGLQPGDSLREANGIRLSAADDLIVAIVKPLQGNQPVRVKARRNGSELELLLVNASACGSGAARRSAGAGQADDPGNQRSSAEGRSMAPTAGQSAGSSVGSR